MKFIVMGLSTDGIVAYNCEAPPRAYEKAVELEEERLESVLVIENGRQYRPAEFQRLVLHAAH